MSALIRKRPSQHDTMGDLITPVDGYRGALTKKGVQPKNHMKDNVKDMRMKQLQMKQEKDDRNQQEIQSRSLYKLPQFQNVESRLYNKPNSASGRAGDDDLENYEGDDRRSSNFLTKGQSGFRREQLANQSMMARLQLEDKLGAERVGNEKPASPRKPAVPRSNELALLPGASNADFIQRNKLNAISMPSTKRNSFSGENSDKHEEFGKVPQYLEERKAKWAAEEDERKRRMPDPDCPPGMCLMPENERQDTLRTLEESREEALNQLRRLPFVIETITLKKKQESLENKLREIDRALSIFSKPKVYIAADR
jgi:hypothetical protein